MGYELWFLWYPPFCYCWPENAENIFTRCVFFPLVFGLDWLGSFAVFQPILCRIYKGFQKIVNFAVKASLFKARFFLSFFIRSCSPYSPDYDICVNANLNYCK